MLHRFTQHLLLCPPVGFSKGYHLSYWSIDDVTLLPAEALPHPGEPTNQGCSCPGAILCMHCVFVSGLLHPSFLFQLLKGKHLQITEQLHTEYFICHGSHILGR